VIISLSDKLSDNRTGLGRTEGTSADGNHLVHAVLAEAMHLSRCLRDEEANAGRTGVAGGSLTELP
jgi:hypothetical protein